MNRIPLITLKRKTENLNPETEILIDRV